MKMTMKLAELLTLNNTLKAIIDDNRESNIDPLFKFQLLGIMKSLEAHTANFELIRNEKIKEYGSEDDSGNISISTDNKEAIEKFNADLSRLIQSDVSVDIEKLKARDIFDKGVKAEYLVGLYGIVEQ